MFNGTQFHIVFRCGGTDLLKGYSLNAVSRKERQKIKAIVDINDKFPEKRFEIFCFKENFLLHIIIFGVLQSSCSL